MAWVAVNSGATTFQDGNAGHSYTLPGGAPANGSLMVLGINSVTTVSTPSGWTVALSDVSQMGAYVFYKIAGSSEPSSVTITTSGDHVTALSYFNYTGNTATPLDVTATARFTVDSNRHSTEAVSPTVTSSSELAFVFGMLTGTGGGTGTVTSIVPPTGYTTMQDSGLIGGTGVNLAAEQLVFARTDAVGAQGSLQATWSGLGFDNGTTIFVSFLSGSTTISVNGIASAEGLGTVTVTGGSVVIVPAGIAGAEAFGTALVATTGTALGITVTGIASLEAMGAAVISGGNTALPTVTAQTPSAHPSHHNVLHDRHNRNSQVEVIAASGSARTINLSSGATKVVTLSANCTLSVSSVLPTEVNFVELRLVQDATGSRTVTWPAGTRWPGGTAPTLTAAAGATDRIVLTSYDGGSTWYGDVIGLAYA